MRGSIDQQPILFEIGKDGDLSAGEASSTKQKGRNKKKGVRFEPDSSDESSGPPTPVDVGSLKNEQFHARPRSQSQRDAREPAGERRANIPLASPSLQDVISNSVRPRRAVSQVDRLREEDARLHAEKMRKTPSSYSPEVRKHTNGRDYFPSHEIIPEEHHYPGTLDELKHRRRGDSKGQAPHLPFAERHRTMSGSSDSADHRPKNMRHMSAMGYSGESKTPSFARDHPAHLHSPPPPDPRNAPAFRTPRPHRKDVAVETDSDSEISPDETPRKGKRSSRTVYKPDGPELPTRSYKHDYPLRPHPEQTARPITPIEQRSHQSTRPVLDRPKAQDPRDLPVEPARSPRPSPLNSPSGSPRNSMHVTPPHSPIPGTRGSFTSKESSPTVTKAQRVSRAPSPSLSIPLYPVVPQLKCADEQHHPSSSRHPSRPNSPTLHPPNDLTPERQSRDTSRHTDLPRSRQSTSPLPAPTPSRTLKPDLKIDIQTPTPEPPMKTWDGPRPGLHSRPVSGQFSAAAIAYAPKPLTSAPLWAEENNDRIQRQPDHYAPSPSAQLPPSQSRYKPRGPPSSLPPCPRPGFVTGYNDWWTLQNAPDLDICPDCKRNLEAAGSSASFMASPPRSSTYKTRCDLSVPWVRMAWLLVLQGKASKSLVGDVIMGIAKETPCPGRTPSVRNWRRIYDPEIKKFVPNFDACPSCVRSVETLFPNLRGRFEPVPHADQSKKRVCHLTFESPRFARYIDLLDDISKQAYNYRREPNMLRFVNLARSFSDVPACRRDDQFRGVSWHFIPHLPDFTVCEECYLDIVWPHVTRQSEIAKSFNPTLQMPHSMSAKLSCQLYSARMRDMFERCCERNDFQGLRREAMARVGKERELQARVEHARTLPPDWRANEMEGLIAEWRRWE